MALNYRLNVWPPTGAATPRTVLRDETYILSSGGRGLRLRLGPEGECKDGVWSAKGAGLQLPPLSAVQVEYLFNDVWVPLFFGEVREGGNVRDVNGEDYNLWGMSRRFEEISLPPGFSTPQQPAHLTVRAIAQAVIGSGQLGTPALVQYVEALCPDLGFDCTKVEDGAEQDPASLLKRIAEEGLKFGVTVRWGVDPQRRFFCRAAKNNTRDVTAELVKLIWKSPVAVAPCTTVNWYLGKYPNGRPLTYRSTLPSAAQYGPREKRLSVGTGVKIKLPQQDSAAYTFTPPLDGISAPASVLYDGQSSYGQGNVTLQFSSSEAELVAQLTATAPARWLDYAFQTFANAVRVQLVRGAVTTVLHEQVINGTGTFLIMGQGTVAHDIQTGDVVEVRALNSIQLNLSEFRLDRVNSAELDGLAKFHERPPSVQPADLQTVVFVPPVDLPGRVKVTGAAVGNSTYDEPLETAEYRLTDQGLQMGWLAGQAEDPASLAQASLIHKRDGEAVITAITAQV